jgi:hypothetical protein
MTHAPFNNTGDVKNTRRGNNSGDTDPLSKRFYGRRRASPEEKNVTLSCEAEDGSCRGGPRIGLLRCMMGWWCVTSCLPLGP